MITITCDVCGSKMDKDRDCHIAHVETAQVCRECEVSYRSLSKEILKKYEDDLAAATPAWLATRRREAAESRVDP